MELVVAFLVVVIGTKNGLGENLGDTNVCPVEERFTVNVTQMVLKTKHVRHYKWCLNYPPRCSEYTTEEQYVPEVIEEEKSRQVLKCCPGYSKDERTGKCVSTCSTCINGDCILNECDCHIGYWGEACDKTCEINKWGKNCKFECLCSNGRCNAFTGECHCEEGWTGTRCEEPVITVPAVVINTSPEDPIEKSLTSHPEHAKYTPLEKYLTFNSTNESNAANSSHINQSMHNSTTSTEINTKPVPTTPSRDDYNESKHNEEFVNNKTNDLISITQLAKSNLKAKATNDFEFSTNLYQKEDWLNDDHGLHAKDHENRSSKKKSQLVFSVGAVAGIVIAVILIIILTIFTKNRFRAQQDAAEKGAENDHKGIPAVAFYSANGYNTPSQTELPLFDTSGYLIPIELDASKQSEANLTNSLKVPNNCINHQNGAAHTFDTFYDHPPSTGSYKAASIPEPPEGQPELSLVGSKEHLYDEIPCWNQPLINQEEQETNVQPDLSLYANTLKR